MSKTSFALSIRLAVTLLAINVIAPRARAVEALLLQDSYVDDSTTGSPAPSNTNYGSSGDLRIFRNATINRTLRSFIKFSMQTLPPGTTAANVTQARLRLWVNSSTATLGAITLTPITSAWDETTVKSNNISGMTFGTPVFSELSVNSSSDFISIDVTSWVKAWVAGTLTNEGFKIEPSASMTTLNLYFDSKDSIATSHEPELEIVLGSVGPQGPTGPQGLTGANGPQGSAGATGIPGATGPQGLTGATGPAGVAGATGVPGQVGPVGATGVSGTNAGFGYTYSTDTSATDPGDNTLKFDQLNYRGTPATKLYINDDDVVGHGLGTEIGTWDDSASATRAKILIYSIANPQRFVVLGVTGSNVHHSSPDWTEVNVAIVSGAGTIQNGEAVTVVPLLTGDKGDIGLTGPAGTAGAQGDPGPAGPVGPTGSQGPAGAQGVAGTQGSQGPAGPAGATGPQGAAGAPGSLGLVWKGAWSGSTSYAVNDAVSINGAAYIALQANTNAEPPSAGVWDLIAEKGATPTHIEPLGDISMGDFTQGPTP